MLSLLLARWRALLPGVLVVLLSACGDRQPPAEQGLLSHVPADTPYVFTNLQPLPEAAAGKLLALYEQAVTWYRERLASETQPPVGSDAAKAWRLADALLAELQGKLNPEGYAELGLRLDGRVLVYGEGLAPVLRIELADGQKVRELIARIERRAGLQAPRALYGDTEYLRIDLEALRLLIGVRGNELIAGLVPAERESELLPRLFGEERPATTLAHSGEFEQLLRSYQLPGYGDGYVSLERLGGRLQQLSSAGAGGSVPGADANCRALVEGLLGGVPRLVMGTTEASGERYGIRMVAETSPAVGQVLAGLAYPVPGLGVPTDALFAMGLGVDIPRLRGGLRQLLQYLARSRGDCALVDAAAIEQAIPQLELVLGPMTAMFKGLYLELIDLQLDPETRQPRDLRLRALAEVDDPRGVFAMAGMLNPELAQLQVPEDGTPVAVPAQLLPPAVPPLQVAIRERSLVVTAGADGDRLARELLAAAPATPAPLLAVSYNFERLGRLLQQGTEPLAALAAEQQGLSPEQVVADLQGMLRMYQAYRVIAFSLTADARGLVLDERIEFR
jgi:hypothetical protein